MNKIRKSHRKTATELETKVAQVIYDSEQNSKNVKSALTGFVINSVKVVEVTSTKTAAVVFFPLRFIRKLHKVQKMLVADLEKKLQRQFIFVAQRKIQTTGATTHCPIPRSRTMKAVQEAVLDDICYPNDICGKRIRQLVDGSKHLKVYLDARDKNKLDSKVCIE